MRQQLYFTKFAVNLQVTEILHHLCRNAIGKIPDTEFIGWLFGPCRLVEKGETHFP